MNENPAITREQAIDIVRTITIPWLQTQKLDSLSELSFIHQQMSESDSELHMKDTQRDAVVDAFEEAGIPILDPILAPVYNSDGEIISSGLTHQGGDTRYIGYNSEGSAISNPASFQIFSFHTPEGPASFSFECPQFDVLRLGTKLTNTFDVIYNSKLGLSDDQFKQYALPYAISQFRVLERIIHIFDGSNNRTLNEWMRLQYLKLGGDIDLDGMIDKRLDHNLANYHGSFGAHELNTILAFVSDYSVPLLHRGSDALSEGYYDLRMGAGYNDNEINFNERKRKISQGTYQRIVMQAIEDEIDSIERTVTMISTALITRNTSVGITNPKDVNRQKLINAYFTGGELLKRSLIF